MKYFAKFLLLIFILNCQNKNLVSFTNLKDAFLDWYYKYNPITSTFHGLHSNDSTQNQFNENAYIEKLEDVNRFKIELSQIDETKLNDDDKVYLNRLNALLDDIALTTKNYLDNGWLTYINKY